MTTSQKIFCIGAHKTGTTSLEEAFKILNYKSWPISSDKKIFQAIYKPGGIISDWNNRRLDRIFDLTKGWDFFSDSPWNHGELYKELDINFPESLFILSIRDSNHWKESHQRWNIKMNISTTSYYPIISQDCYGIPNYLHNLDLAAKSYEKRNQEIIDYFSGRDNLLVIDLEKGDGWSTLCTFLNRPKPNVPFPHANKTK